MKYLGCENSRSLIRSVPRNSKSAFLRTLAQNTRAGTGNVDLRFGGGHRRASFSYDGRWVICGSDDRTVVIWSTETDEVRHLPDERDEI